MLTELELVERIAGLTTTRPGVALGIGDDAAVLSTDPPLVVTQDLLVDGVHFRRATSGMGDIGHKALAVNLSDLAAMGAQPVAAFVGLGLPDERPLSRADIDEIYGRMEDLAADHDVTIAGGDVTRAPVLLLAVTAIGRMPGGVSPLRRSGARPGDILCVTGALGAATAGLMVLETPALAARMDTEETAMLTAAHRRPVPRVAAGMHLAAGGATAMLDCSDGLALDALRMARASGVRIEIDLDAVPVAGGVGGVAAAAGVNADVLAATGGDDYELIAAVPADALPHLRTDLGVPLSPVGRILTGEPGLEALRAGCSVPLESLGWEHRPGAPDAEAGPPA